MIEWLKTNLIVILAVLLVVSSVANMAHAIVGYFQSNKIEKLNVELMAAEAKLCEMQKDTLRSAILTQNEAVEAQRIDEAKRAEEYKRKFVTISAKYAEAKKQLSGLSGDEECKAMRKIINEDVK